MSPATLEAQAIALNPPNAHHIRELPVRVILPHSRCNCRCVMCDIWRIRQIREITASDLEPHMAGLRELNEGQKVAYEIVADKRTGKSSAGNLRAA